MKSYLTSAASLLAMAMFAPARDDAEPIGIMELEENLDDVEKPPELPNGIYEGEIQNVQTKTADTGNEYFAITCVIPPEEIPGELSEFYPDGAIMSYNRVLTPKGRDRRRLYRVKELLAALGLPTNVTSINPDEWMGRPVRIQTAQTKYQGEFRAGIRALLLSTRAAEAGNGAEREVEEEPEAEEEAPAPRRRAAARPAPAPARAGRR